MMIKRKTTKKYYFTVEGETEKWYLEWLRDRINECEEAEFKVSFDAQIQKNPLKRAKSLIATGKTEIWHLSDYESDDPVHVKQFLETIQDILGHTDISTTMDIYTHVTQEMRKDAKECMEMCCV